MDLILWMFGVLLTLSSVLLGIVYRHQQKRFHAIERDIKMILERTDTAAFLAMDKTREVHWMSWRINLDGEIVTLAERLNELETKLARVEGRMNGTR